MSETLEAGLAALSLGPPKEAEATNEAVFLTLRQGERVLGAERVVLTIRPRVSAGITALVHDTRMCAHKNE